MISFKHLSAMKLIFTSLLLFVVALASQTRASDPPNTERGHADAHSGSESTQFPAETSPERDAVADNRGSRAQQHDWDLHFEDDFAGRSEPGKHYRTGPAMQAGWTVRDSVLVGKQVRDDHGSVIRTEVNFDDIDISFDFRFHGGTSFNFVIDDKNEKSVHAGHICRVSVFPKRLIAGDDKTGSMNLEVREQRKNPALAKQSKAALDALLARTRAAADVDIQPKKWHQLRVRIEGESMNVFLDGEMVIQLKSPGIAHPTKTQFGFTVNGSVIEFDNLRVFQPKVSK